MRAELNPSKLCVPQKALWETGFPVENLPKQTLCGLVQLVTPTISDRATGCFPNKVWSLKTGKVKFLLGLFCLCSNIVVTIEEK